MSTRSPDGATAHQAPWEQFLAASHEPDKTISANLENTRRVAKAPLADGIRRLGYEFGMELGRGGLGVVSLATQQVFDRPVAVKRLLCGGSDREEALKFFAEALVTAQLEHPHIVPIHDLMADDAGQLQLVMKRVVGQSWRDLLHPNSPEDRARAKGMTLEDHLDILLKVCDAISFAHGRGILHRDLKPENVMVGAYGEVLVMDWGCAVAFGSSQHHPAVPRVEEVAHIAGTPCYMAPEMALVQAKRIGPQSDVYQLGAILYEALTRQKPHRGGNVYEILRDAVHGQVVAPGQAAPDRDIPAELADICLAALVKDASKRIRAVGDLAQRLKNYRQHAQAVTLVASARTQLELAAKNRQGADDALRKAVSLAEQARGIWPEWPVAGQVLLEATLGYAQQQLNAGAATLAVNQAGIAATIAKTLGNAGQVAAANALVTKARAVAASQAVRHRQLRLARLGMITAGIVLVIGLVVFLYIVSAEQRRTSAALAKAERALAALTTEQVARTSDQKTSAPALVAQARKAMAGKDWEAAITALRTAISFNPHLIEAHQLHVNVLAAAKRYSEVLVEGAHWQDAAGGDATATRLIALCRILNANPDPVETAQTQLQLADLFETQQLYILADSTSIPPAKRLEIYRKRINAAWPGVGAAIIMRADGKLVTEWGSLQSKGFKERTDVVDLEPIHGLPFAVLHLTSTGVRKLDALAGMPLEDLAIENTAVTDLSPLRGLRLRSLKISNTRIADLSPLAGMPLTSLWAVHTPISDLSPLRNMPLTYLNMSNSSIGDLSPLAQSPLEVLFVGDRVTDLSPLRKKPLKELTISGNGDLDLAPLAGIALQRITISTTGTIDLSPLYTELFRLDLVGALLSNPTALSHLHITELSLDGYMTKSAPDLRNVDGKNLDTLIISHANLLDLHSLSAPRLKHLRIAYCGNIDLAPLAASPMTELDVGSALPPFTWRSLSAFRKTTTLANIVYRGKKMNAAEFWATYRPDVVGQ